MAKTKREQAGDLEEDDDSKIFPQRLMEILNDERSAESICWLPHGRAFIVRNRKLFAETVMPIYFSRKAKYSSFTRKLNRWNFTRVSSGPELGAYYHEFFLRDKPHLAAQMFCKNARSKLAMASIEPLPKAEGQATSSSSTGLPRVMPKLEDEPSLPAPNVANHVPSSILNSFAKIPSAADLPSDIEARKNAALMAPYSSNIQALENQLLLLHQEQANRLMLEQAIAMSMQHRAAPDPALALQESRLMHMRQMMELRMRQRQQGRVPTNPRASAA